MQIDVFADRQHAYEKSKPQFDNGSCDYIEFRVSFFICRSLCLHNNKMTYADVNVFVILCIEYSISMGFLILVPFT